MSTPAQRRILFVDDDQKFLQMIERIMRLYGKESIEILSATTASAALNILQDRPVNLVVLDVCMPVVDGLQFLSILNRRYPDIQKVVLTAYATEAYRTACLGSGAELFLEKPTTSEGLECIFATLDELSRWQPEVGFRGVLRRVGLMDVLQMECLARNSSILVITAPTATGSIYISEGAIVHAEVGDQIGEDAFYHLFSLVSGDFKLNPFTEPPERSINAQWEYLLMEAARLRDEGAESEAVPADLPEAPAEEESPSRVLPFPTLPPLARTEEFLVCSETGDVLHSWQCPHTDQRVSFLEFLSQKARLIPGALPVGAFDRVEFRSPGSRLLARVSSGHGLLVRTTTNESAQDEEIAPTFSRVAAAPLKERARAWFDQHLNLAGLLAASLHFPDRTSCHHSCVPSFPQDALEVLRRAVDDAFKVLKQQRFAAHRARWSYGEAAVESATWKDGTCLSLVFSRQALDLDHSAVDRWVEDFMAVGEQES